MCDEGFAVGLGLVLGFVVGLAAMYHIIPLDKVLDHYCIYYEKGIAILDRKLGKPDIIKCFKGDKLIWKKKYNDNYVKKKEYQ